MNAQTPYELYRVILDYEALQDGFLDRIDDLETTLEQIDMAGDLAKGNVQKLLNKSDSVRGWDRTRRDKRILGWESLGKMLKGTGLALVLVVDDARFRDAKDMLMKRKRPRQPAIAGITRPTWLFTKKKAQEMGKKRFAAMSPERLKKHQRKAAKARWKQRRKPAPRSSASDAGSPDSAVCG
jgi:hypothetical protein